MLGQDKSNLRIFDVIYMPFNKATKGHTDRQRAGVGFFYNKTAKICELIISGQKQYNIISSHIFSIFLLKKTTFACPFVCFEKGLYALKIITLFLF